MQLMTIREVMSQLRLSRGTVYGLLRKGRLTRRKIGGATRVDAREVENLAKDSAVRRRKPVT